jgi:hypothetical protein
MDERAQTWLDRGVAGADRPELLSAQDALAGSG